MTHNDPHTERINSDLKRKSGIYMYRDTFRPYEEAIIYLETDFETH